VRENGVFTVRAEHEGETTRILVRAEKRDMVKIIGRQGKMAHAIRTLIGSMVKPRRYTLDIGEHA